MGETVNETVKLILSLSISGGLFALVLFAIKPFMRNKLSKSFQYYIWIVVLLRFILPFSFGINLMNFTFNASNEPQTVEETVIPNNNPINHSNINPAITDNAITDNAVNNNKSDITEQQPQAPVTADSEKPLNILNLLADNLFWLWLAGIVICSAFNVFGYFRFIRYIQGAAYAVEMPDCGTKVFKSRFVLTPMLVGVIRPSIYLPDTEYADGQLKNIMLHELTHLRRRDVWLKWFVSLVVSVHWFNPVMYFMRREISHACELSCDEAVIRNLDGAAKQSYGDTLISVVAESRYPVGVMSTTMCDEKKRLKERLVSIMNYKKKSKIEVLITAVLALMITCGAVAFGANATGRTLPEKVLTSAAEDTKSILNDYYSAQSTGAFEMFNKKIFLNLVDDWTAEIGDIESPVWNYDSFAGYQYLDHNMLSVSRYEELYYCTFSADNDKSGYVVMSYDGSSLQKISVVETPYLYDFRVNLDEIIDGLKDKGIDLSSAAASRVKWVDTDKNRSDEAIIFSDDNGNAYVCCFGESSLEWSSVTNDYKWDKRPMILVDDSIYMTSDMEISVEADSTTVMGTIVSSVDGSEIPTENGQSNFGCEGSKYAYYKDGIIVNMNGKWIFFEKAVDKSFNISLADLRQLAVKGYELTFEDFNNYEGQEVGSGMYILHFTIEGGYTLLVGGGSTTGKPFYSFLSIPGVEEKIDVRYNDIDEFISKHPVPNELSNQVYGYLDTIRWESIVNTYYSAQNSPAFEMFNKKIYANLADDWTAEIDGIKNPVWNYDSFTRYQILDYNVVSVARHKELYYCTFSADNDKFGYVVMSYDGSSLQKVSVVETPYLYDLQANIEEIADELSETDLDLSSAVASRVQWVDTNKNHSDEVILFTDGSRNNVT